MITYGFFNSVNGDRKYNADQISNYFKGLISNGVFQNVGNAFIVTANSDMSVNIGSGKAYINGKWIDNDNSFNLSIDSADTAYDRIDTIVIRLDYSERKIGIKILKGTASASPSAVTITRSKSLYDLKLAEIRVKANATKITTANITDYRMSNVCGFVTGIITQVDTAKLFLQMQEDYKAVRNSIVKDLNVNTQVVTDMYTRVANDTITDYYTSNLYEPGDSLIIMNEKTCHIYSSSEYSIVNKQGKYWINFRDKPENNSKINVILIKSYVGGTGEVPFYTKSMLDAKFSFENSYVFDKNGKIIQSTNEISLGGGFATYDDNAVTVFISKNVTKVSVPAMYQCKNLKTVYVDNTADNITMYDLDSSINVVYNDSEKDTFFNYAEFLLRQSNRQNKQFDLSVDDDGHATISFE